jgi:hypothetical protein
MADEIDDRILLDVEAAEFYAALDGVEKFEVCLTLYQLYERPDLDEEGRYLLLSLPPKIPAVPWPLLCIDGQFVYRYEVHEDPKRLVIVQIRRRTNVRDNPSLLL